MYTFICSECKETFPESEQTYSGKGPDTCCPDCATFVIEFADESPDVRTKLLLKLIDDLTRRVEKLEQEEG